MSVQHFKQDINGKVLKNQKSDQSDIDFTKQNQKIEITDSLCYIICWFFGDQRSDENIESRLTKATAPFNRLKNVIQYRITIFIETKLRIFRACTCILSALLYDGEVWPLTMAQEN